MDDAMSKFYRALAVAEANIFLYLTQTTDEEEQKRRAAEVTEKLETFALVQFVQQCEGGTVWNPITQRCE